LFDDDFERCGQPAAEILTALPRRRAAVSYLRQRGINAAALPAEWPLGYAPPGWTRLVGQLRGNFADEALLEAGLALRSSRGTLIDTFRDRVIFPMHDSKGRAAGFIGRDVSGNPDTPKYLNTWQTPLFDKGELLYGLNEAHTTNPAARHLVIVEGPLDVLAIVARGQTIGATDLLPIAASGTAFTIAHARCVAAVGIAHHSPGVVALDGDGAGRAAALRAGDKLRSLGLDVRLAVLPNGIDPADYLAQPTGSLDVFRDTHALPLLAVQVQSAIAAQGDRMQWVEGRLGAARAITTYLASYPFAYADAQTGWIADVLDLNVSTVILELADERSQNARGFPRPAGRRSIRGRERCEPRYDQHPRAASCTERVMKGHNRCLSTKGNEHGGPARPHDYGRGRRSNPRAAIDGQILALLWQRS
jgi:DNA primase